MSLADLCQSRSGTTLPAAFYPSPESSELVLALPRDVLRRPRQAPRQLRSNAEILTLRQARCTRLDPCPRFPILVLPAPVPILVLGRRFPAFPILYPRCRQRVLVSASFLGRLSSTSPAPRYSTAADALYIYALCLGRLCLAFSLRPPINATLYPYPCLTLDVPAFPMLYPRR